MTPIHAAGLAPQEQSEGDYEISMFKIIREILKRKEYKLWGKNKTLQKKNRKI